MLGSRAIMGHHVSAAMWYRCAHSAAGGVPTAPLCGDAIRLRNDSNEIDTLASNYTLTKPS
jgi:hypothetical protein